MFLVKIKDRFRKSYMNVKTVIGKNILNPLKEISGLFVLIPN